MTIIIPEPLDSDPPDPVGDAVDVAEGVAGAVADVAEAAIESADDRARAAETRAAEAERRCAALESQLRDAVAEPPDVHIDVETHEAPPEEVPAVEEPVIVEDETPDAAHHQETAEDVDRKRQARRKRNNLYGRAK